MHIIGITDNIIFWGLMVLVIPIGWCAVVELAEWIIKEVRMKFDL